MKIPAQALGVTHAARSVDRGHTPPARATRDELAVLTPTDVDRIDVGGDEDGEARHLTPAERLDRLAGRFEARLDRLLAREGLSEAQIGALTAAKAEFQGLVDRLAGALDSLEPGVAKRGFGWIVRDLAHGVRDALAMTHGEPDPATGADGLGGADGIADAGGADGIAGAGGANDVGGTEREQNGALDGLDDVQSRLDARFDAYLAKTGLDRSVASELGAAKEQFDAVLERLRDAYASGEHDATFLRSGFQTALEALRDELAQIFAGSRDEHGRPDALVRADSVALYQPDGAADPLASLGASLDHVV